MCLFYITCFTCMHDPLVLLLILLSLRHTEKKRKEKPKGYIAFLDGRRETGNTNGNQSEDFVCGTYTLEAKFRLQRTGYPEVLTSPARTGWNLQCSRHLWTCFSLLSLPHSIAADGSLFSDSCTLFKD